MVYFVYFPEMSTIEFVCIVRGGIKKWTLLQKPLVSANISPTKTYYIPNQWKFNEDFAALYRFEIAALIKA